jgi:IS5 family transposase
MPYYSITRLIRRGKPREEAAGKRRAALYKEPINHLEYRGQPNGESTIEYLKSTVRSNVDHIFYRVKRVFGYGKVVYRGILKNTGRLYMMFAGANLLTWV